MRKSAFAAYCAVLGYLSVACASTRGAEKAVARVLVSDQEEEQLGLQVKQELEKKGVRYIQDPQLVSYLRQVIGPITQAAASERKGVRWKLSVIDDKKTVNAFATPGGFIYVYSGLILAADNESELAGVLAHETGHVVARHAARQMIDAYGLEAVLALALGKNPSLLSRMAASIAGQGAILANSRSDETEADELGVRFASAAHYDPHGLVNFFRKLEAQQGRTPAILSWLSDHPSTPNRIEHTLRYIEEHHLTGTKVQTPEFMTAKQRVEAIR